jgi:penicillin amidase
MAAAILFFCILVYWVAVRPLAVTTGEVRLLGAPTAAAGRDRLGIPHIEAASMEGALWVQGYVTAQDRLWQMDLLRRISGGELAEVLGPAMLPTDRESRTFGFRRIAQAAAGQLPAEDRAALEAYRRGVNAFLESRRSNLPLEFQILRYQPRPWEVSDSLLIALHMFRVLTSTWRDEILRRSFLERATPEQVNALLPVRTGHEASPGSNAWVVSGAHTASGKPLLANDPHLEYSIPCIWYTVHLKAPGLHVTGASLPGLPGVIIGHNERIAWGVTNLHFDVQDLYLSEAAVSSATEFIKVRGQADFTLTVQRTRRGPVLTELGSQKAALRWLPAEPGIWEYPFLELNRAANWTEFRRALSRFAGPAQNYVYADIDGNIGYQAAGRLPIRRGYDGALPVPDDGRHDWSGYIPFDHLPTFYNPPSGRIVTANQNPFPVDYPYPVNGNFAPHYRSSRILQLLSRDRQRAVDFLRLQTDVYSPFAHTLARALLDALDRRRPLHPDLAWAASQLRSWDGFFHPHSQAPVLVALTYTRLLRLTLESLVGEKAGLYNSQMGTAFVETLLAAPNDDLCLRALSHAVTELRANPSTSFWGRYLETTIAHPVGHRLPLLNRWFDIGPFAQSGTSTTVKQTTKRLGPSMRLVVDLADFDRSLQVLTTGQSGQPFSPHYKDQWPAYHEGRAFPLLFHSPKIVERLAFSSR